MNDDTLDEWQMLYGFDDGFSDSNRLLVQSTTEPGLTAWELSIFQAIHYGYGQVEQTEVLARYSHGGHETDPKSAAAIQRCFDEEWVQIVTTEFETEMRRELGDGEYFIPNGLFGHSILHEIQGRSVAGIISFGRRGAALWNAWGKQEETENDPWGGHWACGYDPDGGSVLYGQTVELCKNMLSEIFAESSFKHPFTREPIVPVGCWCDRWWQRFERGYRVRFSSRNQFE
jgi:hypothetical protein